MRSSSKSKQILTALGDILTQLSCVNLTYGGELVHDMHQVTHHITRGRRCTWCGWQIAFNEQPFCRHNARVFTTALCREHARADGEEATILDGSHELI